MDFFGIGFLEILFIFLIALIVLGPNDMVKAGRTLGRLLRKIVTSPSWGVIQQTSRELRGLPTRLMREAGLEEEELRNTLKETERSLTDWRKDVSQLSSIDPMIAPPTTTPAASPTEAASRPEGDTPIEPAAPIDSDQSAS